MKNYLLKTIILLILCGGIGFANTLSLSTQDTDTQSTQTSFSCQENINAYYKIPIVPNGIHSLEAIWINPEEKVQEHTKFALSITPEINMFKFWIKFINTKSDINILSFGNRGKNTFNGKWKVIILLDNEEVARKEFNVVCSN